jgi:autotransporter-associated beta strand protein
MTVIPQARFWLLRLLLALLTVGAMAIPTLRAAIYNVTNTNDSGVGSLRQAIIDANANFGFDAIEIDPALAGSTISLASPLPALTDNIGIDGPATGSMTITSATTIFSGGAAISKQSDGTIAFNGANTYSGGTTIDGGAFQGNTAGIQGDITNNSSVVIDQTIAGTYAGDMSGTGDLTKLGAGTLVLSGFNSYSGGTLVSAGTLQGDTTSLQGDITNNSSIVFDQAIPGTYTGSITGSGSLTKLAAGTLTLTGNSTYIGGTTVSAGQLAVNGSILGPVLLQSGATLSGSGQVGSLTNQGIVAPGGTSIATLTVNGDYAQTGGATLQAQINPAGQGDLINATDSATVDGALIITGAGNFDAGTIYTIVSTANGVSGTFSSRQFVFGSGAFEDSQIIYGSTEIQLLLLRNATTLANFAEPRGGCHHPRCLESPRHRRFRAGDRSIEPPRPTRGAKRLRSIKRRNLCRSTRRRVREHHSLSEPRHRAHPQQLVLLDGLLFGR